MKTNSDPEVDSASTCDELSYGGAAGGFSTYLRHFSDSSSEWSPGFQRIFRSPRWPTVVADQELLAQLVLRSTVHIHSLSECPRPKQQQQQQKTASATARARQGLFRSFLVFSFGALCILGVQLCWSSPLYVQGLGFKDVPPAGPAHRAEVGGSIICVAFGKFAGQHKTPPVKLVGSFVFSLVSSCTCQLWWDSPVSIAMMHVWLFGLKERPGEIAGTSMLKPLFLPIRFFLSSRNFRVRFWGLILWYFWMERAKHPGPACRRSSPPKPQHTSRNERHVLHMSS